MPPRNAPAALNDAYQRLHDAVDRYGPLNRGKGVNSFKGADMIDHQVQGLPLNKLGVMVVAAAKIKQWEAVVGEAYAKKLDEGLASAESDEDALRLLNIATMEPDGQQPAESQTPALHCKPSGVVVNKRYLYRLELENDLYRRHLSRYEKEVANSLTGSLRDILCATQDDAGSPDTLMEPHRDKVAGVDSEAASDGEPKRKRVNTADKEEQEGPVILQRNFTDNRSRGSGQQ